jgi:hypothetical protein
MLGRVLVNMGYCQEQDIIEALGVQSGMERVDLTKIKINETIVRTVSPDVAKFYNIIPIREVDGALIVAMADPLNIQVLDDLAQIVGPVRGAVSNPSDVAVAWKANYSYETDSIHEMLADLTEKVGTRELTNDELGIQEIVGDARTSSSSPNSPK